MMGFRKVLHGSGFDISLRYMLYCRSLDVDQPRCRSSCFSFVFNVGEVSKISSRSALQPVALILRTKAWVTVFHLLVLSSSCQWTSLHFRQSRREGFNGCLTIIGLKPWARKGPWMLLRLGFLTRMS